MLDENLRSRRLWAAILKHNRGGNYSLDVLRVGGKDAPKLGVADDLLIAWAAVQERILIARDRSTLPSYLAEYCRQGNRSPGIILPRRDLTVSELVELLVIVAYASLPDEWANTYRWIP